MYAYATRHKFNTFPEAQKPSAPLRAKALSDYPPVPFFMKVALVVVAYSLVWARKNPVLCATYFGRSSVNRNGHHHENLHNEIEPEIIFGFCFLF